MPPATQDVPAEDFSAYDPVPARSAAPDGMPGAPEHNGAVPAGFRAGLTDAIIARMPGDSGMGLTQ